MLVPFDLVQELKRKTAVLRMLEYRCREPF